MTDGTGGTGGTEGAGPTERYQRLSRIATGGMGEVWRARDTVLGREVAVKVLKQEYADDATFRTRFEAEARHAAGLHHPGIASVFDYGIAEGGTPYLVMELVDGKPLSDLIAGGRPVAPDQARNLLTQVAEALAVAHAAGVVHRDVKPANLLVTPDGRVKVTDFGIARAIDSVPITQTGQIVGTPHYLSPEQARGESATAASDVYALGVVLFECLAGHRPFTADTPVGTALAHLQQEVPALPGTVPPPLEHVVRRALAKDPAARYADGGELAAALRDLTAAGAGAPDVPVVAAAAVADPAATSILPRTPAAPTRGDEPVAVPPIAPGPARGPSRRGLYAGGAAVLVLLVAILLVTHPWSGSKASSTQDPASRAPSTSQTPTTEPTGASTPPAPDTVEIARQDYVGKPAAEAEKALRTQGLRTTTETIANPGDQEAGTVADLSPTGTVDKDTRITLKAWGDPASDAPPNDQPTDSTTDGPTDGPTGGSSTGPTDAPQPGAGAGNRDQSNGKPKAPGKSKKLGG